jgi:hypothetical protein
MNRTASRWIGIERKLDIVGWMAKDRIRGRGDGKRFVVHTDEKLTAFLELERITSDDTDRNPTAP